jgi:hypothetical protein
MKIPTHGIHETILPSNMNSPTLTLGVPAGAPAYSFSRLDGTARNAIASKIVRN